MDSPENAVQLTVEVPDSMSRVDSDEWNRLAAAPDISPFLEYEFLSSVEESGCAAPETGWHPRHFILKAGNRILAAAPAYIKTHSMGEFVFDQGLATAAGQMGIDYYPKLVATYPFTPSPGYRFLTDPDPAGAAGVSEQHLGDALWDVMGRFRDEAGLHSHSLLFADPRWDLPGDSGGIAPAGEASLRWVHQYFLWENPGLEDFEAYTAGFRKGQRRNIRRERGSIRDAGLQIRVLSGGEITEDHMDQMFHLYRSTNEQFGPWAAFFLNREWFRRIRETWSHRLRLIGAWRDGESRPLAFSMLVEKGNLLVGRYWGTREYVPNLHFELCYYAPIEYAISRGLRFFDPGMGSPHKARRGFGSREFSSLHRFRDPHLADLFARVLPQINEQERTVIRELEESVPRKTG